MQGDSSLRMSLTLSLSLSLIMDTSAVRNAMQGKLKEKKEKKNKAFKSTDKWQPVTIPSLEHFCEELNRGKGSCVGIVL